MRLGADPEVFMTNINGQLVSVIGKVRGTKHQPFQINDLPTGFTLQQDNVALEFGIPPAASSEEYIQHIRRVKDKGLEILKGLSYSPLSCAVFPEEEMNTLEAFQFGCEPDFNAWTGKKNQAPEPPHPLMRSAGGHIHVETKLPKKPVIQAMDVFLTVPSMLMDESGEDRRKLYGKPGAYRPKPYGVEHRVLSNFWIFDDRYIDWVWRNTARALKSVSSGKRFTDDASRIVHCIESGDKTLAKVLIKEYQLDACY
jgi:hypothetical protein